MVRIVVFDSGLGSLSIIAAIQKNLQIRDHLLCRSKEFPIWEKIKRTIRNYHQKNNKSIGREFFSGSNCNGIKHAKFNGKNYNQESDWSKSTN